MNAEESSQTLRKAEAQELEDRGSDIPAARNNLKSKSAEKRKLLMQICFNK